MAPYASARSRAQVVDVLLAAQLALWALRALGGFATALVPESGLGMMFARGAPMSAPFLLVLFIATAIALLFWVDRSARNLPSLGAPKAIASEHAVGVFFAPLFNLVAIPYVVHHVWMGSDPTPPGRRWLILTWWPSLLLAFAAQQALVTSLLMVVSAASLTAIVRDTQRRQDEQHLDDLLRSDLPLPTGNSLR